MTLWSIRYSAGDYGPLVPKDVAERAFEGIDPERKPLCELTEWRQVLPEHAETIPPPEAA